MYGENMDLADKLVVSMIFLIVILVLFGLLIK